MAGNNEVWVGVTGASGFLGTRVCYDLLQKGYKVRAFVRDPNNQVSVGHLKTMLPELGSNLEFGQIENLSEPPADLSTHFLGCKFIIHCASPVLMGGDIPEEQVVTPAVEGTKKVLQACLEAKVSRLVLTASTASICGTQRKKNPDHVWTEKDWNDEMGSAYSKSKTLAEKAAWEFVEKNPSLELVTIHPSMILGPVYSTRVTSTAAYILDILLGKMADGAPAFAVGVVHLSDVSEAHVVAMTHEKAAGERFLVSVREQHTLLTIANMVKEVLPEFLSPERCKEYEAKFPTKYMGPEPTPLLNSSDPSKIKNVLGIDVQSAKEAVRDQVKSLVDLKLIE